MAITEKQMREAKKSDKLWHEMTSGERCVLLVAHLEDNTKAVAKLASAVAYLGEQGVEVNSELEKAFWGAIATRRNLREALEAEVAVIQARKHAQVKR